MGADFWKMDCFILVDTISISTISPSAFLAIIVFTIARLRKGRTVNAIFQQNLI